MIWNLDTELMRLISLADMAGFKPTAMAYHCDSTNNLPTNVVPLKAIKSFQRNPDIRPFDTDRAISILRAVSISEPLPPIEVFSLQDDSEPPFQYELYDGFHRFHLSRAIGFTHIPIAVHPSDHAKLVHDSLKRNPNA